MDEIHGIAGEVEQPLGTLGERLAPAQRQLLDEVRSVARPQSFIQQRPLMAVLIGLLAGVGLGLTFSSFRS